MPKPRKPIAVAVGRGDFVVGHDAIYFPGKAGLPSVQGKIVAASPARVTFEVPAMAFLLGLPRRTEFVYRRKHGWQQSRHPSVPGAGLALLSSAA